MQCSIHSNIVFGGWRWESIHIIESKSWPCSSFLFTSPSSYRRRQERRRAAKTAAAAPSSDKSQAEEADAINHVDETDTMNKAEQAKIVPAEDSEEEIQQDAESIKNL